MPSHFDTSYNKQFSRPTYDSEEDRKIYELRREADEVLEMKQPPIPTPEMEVEYIDWLKDDFKSDPWLTYRFRKYTAGPKRHGWKNMRQVKMQHRYTFTLHWLLGSALCWPIGVLVGRRMKHYQGGVPIVPTLHYRYTHDFVNVEPARASRFFFRWYAVGTAVVGGFLFAYATVDAGVKSQNGWYNRPDFKPKAAMVEENFENDPTHRSMLNQTYTKHRNLGNEKKGILYRYFFTQDADFELKENPYRNAHPDDVYDPKKPYYSTYSNSFRDHCRD